MTDLLNYGEHVTLLQCYLSSPVCQANNGELAAAMSGEPIARLIVTCVVCVAQLVHTIC